MGIGNWHAQPDFVDVELSDSEQIAHYNYNLATSSVFAQVSSPCPPISELAIAPQVGPGMEPESYWDLLKDEES